jgi:secondary thiamine-phosphate synthase enzyme
MPVKSVPLRINMKGDTQVKNVTAEVQKALAGTGLSAGIVTVFLKHTTASVLIIEDEPGIREDTKAFWERLIPPNPDWRHNARNPGEDNAHSHLRGQLQGPSITLPFHEGTLMLGTWQQIVVIDFDTRARTRDLIVQVLGD